MWAEIRSFIAGYLALALNGIVLPVYLLSQLADRIQYPAFRTVHGYLKKTLGRLYTRATDFLYEIHGSLSKDFIWVRRGNAYVEELLLKTDEILISKPCDIEEKIIEFNFPIFSRNVQLELRFYPSIRLCRYFKRSGNCSLIRQQGKVVVKANVSGSILLLEAPVHIKFLNFFKVLNISGNIPYIEAYVEFSFDEKTLKDGILLELVLSDISRMNLWLRGAGRLNFVFNFTANGLAKIFDKYVRAVLQKVIRIHLDDSIENFQFPVVDSWRCTSENSPSGSSSSSMQTHTGSQTTGSAYSDEEVERPRIPERAHFNDRMERSSSPERAHLDEQVERSRSPERAHLDEQVERQRSPGRAHLDEQAERPRSAGRAHLDEQAERPRSPGSAHSDEQAERPRSPGSAHSDEQAERPRSPGSAHSDEQAERPRSPGSDHSDEQAE